MATDNEKPVRIFLNHVDEYHGFQLSKFLSQCVVGATLEDQEEEEEEGSVHSGDLSLKPKEGCYKVLGTLRNASAEKPSFVEEILQYDTRDQMYEHLVECDVIVYDITQDPEQIEEATWALTQLHQDVEKLESQKIFILLSSVMTWAKSKPADEDDPEAPLTEEDYRKRKPHPNYKEHITAEKAVVKYGKTKKSRLMTYIVASGLTYGCGESIFHSFFKSAWHNAFSLPVYGGGQNVLPMIHVKDLAAIIQNIADSKPKVKYIVAVDDSQGQTLEAVVKAISAGLTTGRTHTCTKEDAALQKDIDQAILDQLMVSLRLEAIYVKENFKMNWACETGLVENIEQIIGEFKLERGLQPIKACLLGPPASGKSTIAQQLCQHYKLHHIRIKDVISEAVASLERSVAGGDSQEDPEGAKAAADADLLEQINENMAENNGRLDDSHVLKFFRQKLASKPCQNQGFVLDGFPKTKQHAEELFAPGEDEEEEDEDAQFNARLVPDFLFTLEASDEFLRKRVMQLPESAVSGTHNTDEGLQRRLADYKVVNGDEETSVLAYFDDKEIHPIVYDVAKDESEMHAKIVEMIKKEVGKPRNYGLSQEEREDLARQEEEARIATERREREERERLERLQAEERKARQQEWAARLEEVKREEHELLETRSEPLRNYLMKHVMPNLTKGLMECSRVRPEDSIDFLAEFLFRNNPEVE